MRELGKNTGLLLLLGGILLLSKRKGSDTVNDSDTVNYGGGVTIIDNFKEYQREQEKELPIGERINRDILGLRGQTLGLLTDYQRALLSQVIDDGRADYAEPTGVGAIDVGFGGGEVRFCLLYTSPSPRD